MIKKKNSFLTFIFSLIPGAGQMYLGFMKRGLSLMSCFFFIILIGVWLNISPFLVLLPLVWFYSFFDTHNLRSIPDDEFYAMEDNYLFLSNLPKDKSILLQGKYRNILAVVLIILGSSILWNNTYEIFRKYLPGFLRSFGYYLPQFIVGIAIILFGAYLIKGKKIELTKDDNKQKESDSFVVNNFTGKKEDDNNENS
jgi:TM2 domain-containing membrane protein YozV